MGGKGESLAFAIFINKWNPEHVGEMTHSSVWTRGREGVRG